MIMDICKADSLQFNLQKKYAKLLCNRINIELIKLKSEYYKKKQRNYLELYVFEASIYDKWTILQSGFIKVKKNYNIIKEIFCLL